VRLSVGSAGNQVFNNTISQSSSYGVYLYKGSDAPENSTPSGHPTGNIFTDNTVDTTGSNIVKQSEADGSVFTGNTFTHAGSSVMLELSAGTTFTGNTFDPNQTFKLSGSTSEPSSIVFHGLSTPVKLQLDAFSHADFTDPTGRLFAAGTKTLNTTLTPAGSDLGLTSALIGTASTAVSAQPYTVLASTGTTAATGSTLSGAAHITVTGVAAGQSLAITAQGLTPLGGYHVRRGSTLLGLFDADASGVLRFTDTPGAAGSVVYAVSVT